MEHRDKIRKIKKFRKIDNIIFDLIREDAREESIKILLLADNEELSKFFKEYEKEVNDNICCLMLDSIKTRLVNDSIMIQNKNDKFGDEEFLSNYNDYDFLK